MLKTMPRLLICLMLTAAFTSCTKDKINTPADCAYSTTGEGRYSFVNPPDSAMVDSLITVTLLWENNTPCQLFQGFNAQISGNSRKIVILTKVDTCNCNNSDFGASLRSYIFSVPYPGIQIVRIETQPLVFQTDTIVVY